MIEQLPPPAPHVLALRFAGRIEARDVDAAAEMLRDLLAREERVSMFFEIDRYEGVSAEALAHDLRAGIALLPEIGRIMRIALVTDVGWIAAAARLEDRILPHVHLRVFSPAERAEALEWVAVPSEPPRLAHEPTGPGLHLIETADPKVVAFEIDGRLTLADIDHVAPILQAAWQAHDRIRLLGRVRDWRGFDAEVLFSARTAAMKLGALRHVERYALVGGPSWLARWIELAAPFAPMELRWFPAEREDEAWAWVGTRPA
ncbi:STAS/SEC14 domain-containing protein [Oceanicella actignis]|uniref:STAS/SEC14 domain-containing protein n=1 Tax=Oceanicella actignis TaxID=1189325 RepID=UPI0011E79E6B|nr:STAS/SEC14 domain-containing protein [Oceanicella actignis]TYO88793.1 SpoIIAA-like protein [Oceanicella actignis]